MVEKTTAGTSISQLSLDWMAAPREFVSASQLSREAKILLLTLIDDQQGSQPLSNNQLCKSTGLSKWKLQKARLELQQQNMIHYHKGGSQKNGPRLPSYHQVLPLNQWKVDGSSNFVESDQATDQVIDQAIDQSRREGSVTTTHSPLGKATLPSHSLEKTDRLVRLPSHHPSMYRHLNEGFEAPNHMAEPQAALPPVIQKNDAPELSIKAATGYVLPGQAPDEVPALPASYFWRWLQHWLFYIVIRFKGRNADHPQGQSR